VRSFYDSRKYPILKVVSNCTQKGFLERFNFVSKIPSDTLILSESRLESLLWQYLVFSTGETLNLSLVVSVGKISWR